MTEYAFTGTIRHLSADINQHGEADIAMTINVDRHTVDLTQITIPYYNFSRVRVKIVVEELDEKAD